MHKSNVACMQHVTYTGGMSVALGGYLKTLRMRRGLTKAEVIRRVKDQFKASIDRSTLYRAEDGTAWPDGDKLIPLLGVVGGSIEDLVWFFSNKDASILDGITRAEDWVRAHGNAEDVATIVQAQSRPDAEEILSDLEELLRKARGDS